MVGNIHATGTVTQGSSRELKKDITGLTYQEAADALLALDPVKYVYRADETGDLNVGFIAEDVPDLVATGDRKGLSPMDIVGVLTKVLQEQEELLDVQQRQIEELRGSHQGVRSQHLTLAGEWLVSAHGVPSGTCTRPTNRSACSSG